MLNVVDGFDVLVHYVTALRQTVLFPCKNYLVLRIVEVSVRVITRTQIIERQKNPLIMEPVLMPNEIETTNQSPTLEALLE